MKKLFYALMLTSLMFFPGCSDEDNSNDNKQEQTVHENSMELLKMNTVDDSYFDEYTNKEKLRKRTSLSTGILGTFEYRLYKEVFNSKNPSNPIIRQVKLDRLSFSNNTFTNEVENTDLGIPPSSYIITGTYTLELDGTTLYCYLKYNNGEVIKYVVNVSYTYIELLEVI